MPLTALSSIEVSFYSTRANEINRFLTINTANSNLLFCKNATSIKSDLLINYKYNSIHLGDYLITFLNLNLTKFNDFFKYFCTFIFEYIEDIPENDRNKILSDLDIHTKYFDIEEPKHIVDSQVLKKYAKHYFEDKVEQDYLLNMQQLFRDSVDYIYNNNKDKKLEKLNTYERFYILQNINEQIRDFSKKYMCHYDLEFSLHDKNFMLNILENITNKSKNPLSTEDFLINNLLERNQIGNKVYGVGPIFKTLDIYTYFYIVLYHITLNKYEYIKKCNVCGHYFLSKKETTLYCNNKYTDEITCKEYGIKTSQKRKEKEEPIYGKYRQLYAKKAMAVKRNPDIDYYKANYEKWKKECKQFINDIKDGTKTYDEFDEWLNIQK